MSADMSRASRTVFPAALFLAALLWTSAIAQDNAIAILGAFTSAGIGAITCDSSYAGRYAKYPPLSLLWNAPISRILP
jgi:hypothetical protein